MDINRMHQTGTVPITGPSGWLSTKCNTMYRGERKVRPARGFHVCNFAAVSLLVFIFIFPWLPVTSAQIEARWGAFSTKVPFSLLGQVLPGNKTKTTGFHSMKQFSLPLLRDLPLQSIGFQNRLAGRQKLRP